MLYVSSNWQYYGAVIGLLLTRLKEGPDRQWLPSSVCRLFRGHILKTTQDRPIVAIAYYLKKSSSADYARVKQYTAQLVFTM